MVFLCCVQHCSNKSSKYSGTTLFTFPFENDARPEAMERRKRWIDFVVASKGMANWQPTKSSRICSQHFTDADFERRYDILDSASNYVIKKLKVDETGISVWPTIFLHSKPAAMSPNSRRKSVQEILDNSYEAENPFVPEDETQDETIEIECSHELQEEMDSFMQTDALVEKCVKCQELLATTRSLHNKIIDLETREQQYQRSIQTLESAIKCESAEEQTEDDVEFHDSGDEFEALNESYASIEVEPGAESGSEFFPTPKKSKLEIDTDDEHEDEIPSKLASTSTNLRREPKFIVFLSQLLLLFKFCPICKSDHPLVETESLGTMAIVKTLCSNPKCPKKDIIWNSQPIMPGTKMPAGNFMLCFAILVAGGTASKVLQIFSHMGMCCFSLKTYFMHQKTKLFPSIYLHWQRYQKKLLDNLVEKNDPVVLGGDARHDSMGHSAKYGAYTIFCCCSTAIIHFALIQRNQAGNSPAMEYMGFQQCMEFLLGTSLVIGTLITDRHTSIAKHMRERLPNIKHYFDIWHIKKKIGKVLTKISQLSGCEAIKAWIRPCENHFYWSVTSTITGNGMLIWAKFKSFLSHIIDKHDNLPDPLFNKCHHGEIEPRQWLLADSMLYDKVRTTLTKPSLVSGIKQASPVSQTSCLEGFHSVINHFAPKMIAFSYNGMLVRHILASIHFNYNLQREVKTKEDGSEQVYVVYPKFKNGEATVRSVRVKQNFEYVEEIYETYLEAMVNKNLGEAAEELEMMTPEPMNTMFDKQDRDEAIRKRNSRKQMLVADIPGTAQEDGSIAEENVERATPRAKPKCTVCGQPMKGHKNVVNCPKNQK